MRSDRRPLRSNGSWRRGVSAGSSALRDARGASFVEYIVLLGVVALVAIGAYAVSTRKLDAKMREQGACVVALDGSCGSSRGASESGLALRGGRAAAMRDASSAGSSTSQQSGAWYWASGVARGIGLQVWDDVKGLATLGYAVTLPGAIDYATRGQPNPAVEAVTAIGRLALWATPPMQMVTAMGGPDPIGDTVRQVGRSIRDSWRRDPAETIGRGAFEIATIVAPIAKARTAGEIADVARAAERGADEARAIEAGTLAARTAREGAVASRYFTPEELMRAHPTPAGSAIYHGVDHTKEVADMAEALARARGLPEDEARFLGQVAAVHDWDPARVAGTPARVKATLAALNDDYSGVKPLAGDGGSVLRNRFGWDDAKMRQAQALIQRTEFPFDAPHPAYPGTTPATEYQRMVSQLPPTEQDFVLREGAILSEYADKGSGYMVGTTAQVHQRVEGLSNEIAAVTGKTIDMKPGTAAFIDSVGQPSSFAADQRIATELGRPAPSIPGRNEVFGVLPESYAQNFERNLSEFRKYQKPPP